MRAIRAKEGSLQPFGDKELQWRGSTCMTRALRKIPREFKQRKHPSGTFVRTKLHHRPDDACREVKISAYLMVRTKYQGMSGRANQRQNFRIFEDHRPDDATFRPDETPADQI